MDPVGIVRASLLHTLVVNHHLCVCYGELYEKTNPSSVERRINLRVAEQQHRDTLLQCV